MQLGPSSCHLPQVLLPRSMCDIIPYLPRLPPHEMLTPLCGPGRLTPTLTGMFSHVYFEPRPVHGHNITSSGQRANTCTPGLHCLTSWS